jgi:hypothetical protein
MAADTPGPRPRTHVLSVPAGVPSAESSLSSQGAASRGRRGGPISRSANRHGGAGQRSLGDQVKPVGARPDVRQRPSGPRLTDVSTAPRCPDRIALASAWFSPGCSELRALSAESARAAAPRRRAGSSVASKPNATARRVGSQHVDARSIRVCDPQVHRAPILLTEFTHCQLRASSFGSTATDALCACSQSAC